MPDLRMRLTIAAAFAAASLLATPPAGAQHVTTLRLPALHAPVEILRDSAGISHIYARNEHDLFFAQGWSAARDRLFQLEIWRRQATGTVSELLGPRELERDVGTRLFRYRGDLTRELTHYHPHGVAIVQAFVDGINAYIAETERRPELVPFELRLLGTRPRRWTPDVVISRHQGLLGNVEEELNYGRAVAAVGPDLVKSLAYFHPANPDVHLDSAIDGSLLSAPILAKYEAFHSGIRFRPEDIVPSRRADAGSSERLSALAESLSVELQTHQRRDIGSNNWVVSGRLTASGMPMLANDPHRAQSAPSLRYWVHLDAPGWHVIGGGEPEIPGISIGHNDDGAWGLTIFETDGEDLYVYRTNPRNRRQYWYRGHWQGMRVIRDTIPVKGQPAAIVDLAYTRHGPVVYEDTVHHVAYAVRAAWLEPGGAPYMASLRMDQARTWEQFRDACAYSNIPGENMVWADRSGTIGWQAVGIAPIRRNFSGLVPVPGDGRYEWAGYLPIKEKPHVVNPPAGFFATANNDLIPPNYPHMDAVGYEWADPFRWQRITEVLGAATGRKLTLDDMSRLQTDYASLPARRLVPLLAGVTSPDSAVDAARVMLLQWDRVLDKDAVAAGIYEMWLRRIDANVATVMIPRAAQPYFRGLSQERVIDWLTQPSPAFGVLAREGARQTPAAARDALVLRSLTEAVAELSRRFGANPAGWRWGQARYHHATILHPLSAVVDSGTRSLLDAGPAPRGGDANTVGATGGGDNQAAGASFRIAVDLADWERTRGINTPGQSGNPANPHSRDLFTLWADDSFFVVPFRHDRVLARAEWRTLLVPR